MYFCLKTVQSALTFVNLILLGVRMKKALLVALFTAVSVVNAEEATVVVTTEEVAPVVVTEEVVTPVAPVVTEEVVA